MARRLKKKESGDGRQPTTELLLLAVLVIDKLTQLYRQSGRT